jgi:hypothetical protein
MLTWEELAAARLKGQNRFAGLATRSRTELKVALLAGYKD